MNPPGGAGFLAPFRAPAIIVAVALAVMVPELLLGITYTNSFRYNVVWAEQFTRLFAGGELYPRWLPLSWDGMGSPAFYFYPPLYFWLTALIRAALPGGSLDIAVSLATGSILAVSGLAMRCWLRPMDSDRAATIGATAYMLAPYHLHDIYTRGALAELTAYALIPLILIGIRGVAERRPGADALLAAAYAALALGHLPLALLTSVTAIPAYTLWRAWRMERRRATFLLHCLIAGATGLMIAAVQLVPAIALLPHVAADALGGPFFSPQAYFFWWPAEWRDSLLHMELLIGISVGMALFALAVALGRDSPAESRFWGWFAVACFLLLSGALPWVWRIGLLAQVQFAWRLLPVMEFATITGIVAGGVHFRHPLVLVGLLPFVLGYTIMLMMAGKMLYETGHNGAHARRIVTEIFAEAPEYLPRGFPMGYDPEHRADPSKIILPAPPLIVADDPAARIFAVPVQDGGLIVRFAGAKPARIVARRFAFPGWRVSRDDGIAIPVAIGPDHRVSWTAGPGPASYRLERVAVREERLGWAIGALGLLALLALVLKTCLLYRARARGDD